MSERVDNDEMVLPEDILEKLHCVSKKSLKEVMDIWCSIYGPNDDNLAERLSKLEKDLQTFWEYQIDDQQDRKASLLKSIEQTGAQAFALEKALGLPSTLTTMKGDVPLVQLEEQMWKLLNSYRDLREKRLQEFSLLQNKEKELCLILDEHPQFASFIDHSTDCQQEMPSRHRDVPTCEDLEQCKDRIRNLEQLVMEMEYDFQKYKYELRSLLMECEIKPFKAAERFACSDDGNDFPVTKKNLLKLEETIKLYSTQKQSMMMEANLLKEEITKLSKKLHKDPEQLENFLSQNSGSGKMTLEKLKEKLNALKEERSHKLKELILCNRTQLDEWWTKCCYTDEQKAMFRPYNSNYFSEDILQLLELELEQLQNFYEQHKRIFQLMKKHQELWDRLLHLESEASQTDRLFSNRGGRLLQEEKERKLIQKKVPAIKSELVTLVNEYKARTNQDFMYFGVPIMDILEQKEEERELSKENQKLTRKMANTEKVLLESRLGARPVVGAKRKMANQQPSSCTKVMKMAAPHSTTSSTASSASYKTAASSVYGQKVYREERPATRLGLPSPGRALKAPGPSYATVHTPMKTPAASTPENGVH